MILDKAVIIQVIGVILELTFYVFTIIEFGGTPEQLLLCMRVKDENTLEKYSNTSNKQNSNFWSVVFYNLSHTTQYF
ncbi:hypothetical protein EJB10_04175 [Wolbachia endosymbiont of Brugia malayi]|uniref:hypothetical protein n=1 Tax=Wolbachia endosymbiont of Brugia malayi TaxID=80849 RepID=UPI00004C937D|nr:hypothetical protein [Wolbachia endosymbiont of Brugia malayi]AAW70956.1 Predicted protein [Wolbachia endosymbiont strain TRS of Brugia malayi]QCB61908.1 hypothetical protein EJB10_04175 [Wolbachia endosymbiont of Brugia malayi]